jgi:D-3-phosphoglycerate dehydrogenase
MQKKIVVHTGARAETPLPIEAAALDQPDIAYYQRGRCATPEQVLEAVRDADVALCGGEPYTREVLANARRLKAVIRYGIGVDTIDLDAASDCGVMAVNFPDFCIREVANHALVLILACAKKITRVDRRLRTTGWASAREALSPMGTIHGETLGLIAMGNIARALTRCAQAMAMRVIAHDPFAAPETFAEYGVEAVSLEQLAARSDYVSCHLPLNPKTRGMVDARFFSQMKPSAYFINTSRGAVVNEADLVTALQQGQIAGAGLDVFEREPISPEHLLCQMENVILTPHSASWADATFEALHRRVGEAALTIARGGVPQFVANPEVLSHRRQ